MENKLPPNALIVPVIEHTDFTKGDIEYDLRCTDWTPFLTTKEPQKFKFDTNGCSQNSGINSIEIQFNFLRNDFSLEALKWFENNGYIDANGNFDFSWRYTGIKAGTTINGNSQLSLWDSVRHYGLLPRKMLNYTMEQSQKFNTQEEMCADFWNPKVITKEMESVALGSKKWFNTEYEYTWFNLNKSCPLDLLKTEVKHAPLHIGTPVCPDWNTGDMHPCGRVNPAHATTMYGAVLTGEQIFDQYNPYEKIMSVDYFIPIVVKGVVTVKAQTIGQLRVPLSFFEMIKRLFRELGIYTGLVKE